jgi:hypothetical protein
LQSILISYVYVPMWVHPKAMFLKCNGPLWLALHKKSWEVRSWLLPKYKHFLPMQDYASTSLLLIYYTTRANFLANDMGQIVMLFLKISWIHILECILLPPHCLSRIPIPHFVHHHSWPKLLQKLEYLLWSILNSLIGCGFN